MTAAAGTRTPNHKEHIVPDEVTPETGNTTATDAAQIDWESADNPYVQRYRDAQSHLTPVQQENARLRAYEDDRDAYFRLGEKHGVQFEIEEEQQQQAPTGDPQTAQEVAELRAWKEQVEAERQQERAAAGEELFHQDLDEWADAEGVKLSQADHNAIFGLLMKAPDPTQESAARQVFEAHVAAKKAEREQWEQEYETARKRPRVPHTPGGSGATETGVPDWSGMTPAQIDKYMAERAMSG